jgi:hypothetical protein
MWRIDLQWDLIFKWIMFEIPPMKNTKTGFMQTTYFHVAQNNKSNNK